VTRLEQIAYGLLWCESLNLKIKALTMCTTVEAFGKPVTVISSEAAILFMYADALDDVSVSLFHDLDQGSPGVPQPAVTPGPAAQG
jgi:hypothetical protein